MSASEGDGTPRKAASRSEEEEYGHTPVSAHTGVSPVQARESSLAGSGQVDEERHVTRRDLARARRTLDKALGVSLKSMHEEFTRLLTSTQQECAARIESVAQLLPRTVKSPKS